MLVLFLIVFVIRFTKIFLFKKVLFLLKGFPLEDFTFTNAATKPQDWND